MGRQPFNVATAILALGCWCALVTGQSDSRPNVLFISVDDLNDWVGCLGGHPHRTLDEPQCDQ